MNEPLLYILLVALALLAVALIAMHFNPKFAAQVHTIESEVKAAEPAVLRRVAAEALAAYEDAVARLSADAERARVLAEKAVADAKAFRASLTPPAP